MRQRGRSRRRPAGLAQGMHEVWRLNSSAEEAVLPCRGSEGNCGVQIEVAWVGVAMGGCKGAVALGERVACQTRWKPAKQTSSRDTRCTWLLQRTKKSGSGQVQKETYGQESKVAKGIPNACGATAAAAGKHRSRLQARSGLDANRRRRDRTSGRAARLSIHCLEARQASRVSRVLRCRWFSWQAKAQN